MTVNVQAEPKRAMKLDDLFSFLRVADPQISPDGKLVAYQVTKIVDPSANKTSTSIWIAGTDGAIKPRQVTSSGKKDAHPRWSPDGKKILFESNRSGSMQLWILDLEEGGEAKQITTISTEASSGIWSPDSKKIAFVSTIYPEFSELPFAESDKKNAEKNEAAEKSTVKAKTFTRLFYRHWDYYVEDKRQHLFVVDVDGKNCRDVTPGDRDAYPTSSTFSSSEDFAFTPDSQHLVFTAVPVVGESWTTNYDLCQVSIDNKSTKWNSLTGKNLAADSGPKFSPDGKKLAYRTQVRAGYEADKWRLAVVDVKPDGTFVGEPTILTEKIDRSFDGHVWLQSQQLLISCDEEGSSAIYEVILADKSVTKFASGNSSNSFTASLDGNTIAFQRAKMNQPPHVMCMGTSRGTPKHHAIDPNAEFLATLDLPAPESVKLPVEGSVDMQMWILKPPGFDPSKKWPVAYLVHGGPQGAWEDGWSNRWNPQAWAAQGYIVAMPNPRGSTGFGAKFCDEISGDWGGKCFRDLMAGVDYLEKLPYVDKNRIGSAGGSFGGYMQNWFGVSTGRFKCLITHCSVWNFESMWGTTDELWFDEFEHGGLPWEKPGKYREFSPHTLAGNLGKFKTPMLIIHNDLDFRCPIGQGHELFSALQRQGVPSRFINFPDEGHWVLKPANSKRWHEEVFAWLTKYVPPGAK
jgi:dipeptidyl aminopeptidase/acylaminoacyl peptidase